MKKLQHVFVPTSRDWFCDHIDTSTTADGAITFESRCGYPEDQHEEATVVTTDRGAKIRALHQEYNCAIANGLVMKARRIGKRITHAEKGMN